MLTTAERPATLPQVVPVRCGERTIGAFVVRPDGVRYRPVVDVTRLGMAALGTVAVSVAALGTAAALRRRPMIGSVTMGPGGWVSLRRTGAPPLRSAGPRPWWARLLGARALEVR
ncbi:hypothetical protein Asp14428_05810 [Actinoplanes sp. NBRC 14428]|uniref:Uncharacterized protein n=1 Tax=Pseudosporangium ferrugineum TaxID=439699 RepID=A0A2T0SHP6_9ACTN|nr:hypothetical protein [Pseudosporangium ferrugineum]PRY32932.1 hypothetical protein CLV70_10191 [Pseudosporangium ferrugineum]BCJ49106.1 hypothetical protein Asp14428_05810 [Actinoplanes sp. NBRC 14428]